MQVGSFQKWNIFSDFSVSISRIEKSLNIWSFFLIFGGVVGSLQPDFRDSTLVA